MVCNKEKPEKEKGLVLTKPSFSISYNGLTTDCPLLCVPPVTDQRQPWMQFQYLPIAPANLLSFISDVDRPTGKQQTTAATYLLR